MKKILFMFAVVIIGVLGFAVYVQASVNTGDLAYTIYDEEGNAVENGVLSKSESRAAFTAVTLQDGYTVKFRPDNAVGFLLPSDRKINFTYKMNASGYMTTQLYLYQSVRVAKNQTIHKGITLSYTTTTRGYYYALVRNDSGSAKNIYGITFESVSP